MSKNEYQKMLESCESERQIEVVTLLSQGMRRIDVADKLKVSIRTVYSILERVRKNMGEVGKGEHYLGNTNIPKGYIVKGTSTFYDEEGKAVRQWVKTDKLAEDRFNAMIEATNEIASQLEGIAIPTEVPAIVHSETLAVYNIGDAHIGMLAHKSETGDDHNLIKAESDLIGVMQSLVKAAPPSETAIIIDVGDFFHSDNQNNETSASKNKLDVDGRWYKVLKVGLMTMIKLVEEALTKHKTVVVKNIIGNHNEHSAIYIASHLSAWFRNEPRVIVDDLPAMFWYYRFGKVLIGATHGHTVKADALGEVMAADCEDIWSLTKYRYWYTGHVHHDQIKEFRTYKFESFRTLAARDAWHSGQGYRSGRDMKCIILHRNYGEIQRHTVNLAMLQK